MSDEVKNKNLDKVNILLYYIILYFYSKVLL